MEKAKPMCEPATWLKHFYPTTIVNDRYDGTYSGAAWLAFACDFYNVPGEVDGGDTECQLFWLYNDYVVGKGETPQEAFDNLKELMESLIIQ